MKGYFIHLVQLWVIAWVLWVWQLTILLTQVERHELTKGSDCIERCHTRVRSVWISLRSALVRHSSVGVHALLVPLQSSSWVLGFESHLRVDTYLNKVSEQDIIKAYAVRSGLTDQTKSCPNPHKWIKAVVFAHYCILLSFTKAVDVKDLTHVVPIRPGDLLCQARFRRFTLNQWGKCGPVFWRSTEVTRVRPESLGF